MCQSGNYRKDLAWLVKVTDPLNWKIKTWQLTSVSHNLVQLGHLIRDGEWLFTYYSHWGLVVYVTIHFIMYFLDALILIINEWRWNQQSFRHYSNKIFRLIHTLYFNSFHQICWNKTSYLTRSTKINRCWISHSIFSLLWTPVQLIYGGKAGLKPHYSEVLDLEKQKTSRKSLL